VAKLARLALSDEEVEAFAGQLSDILKYIETLKEIDTDDVEPTSHALDIVNVFRDDVAAKKFDDEAWRQNAPAEGHGHIIVPRVIEE
jgi:aspartyl-tRNA(Asn)/glutamyl-tRNA(Gln) amidotransferase subunit C